MSKCIFLKVEVEEKKRTSLLFSTKNHFSEVARLYCHLLGTMLVLEKVICAFHEPS